MTSAATEPLRQAGATQQADPGGLAQRGKWGAERLRRTMGLAAGVATQLLFGFTVWHLFYFLRGRVPAESVAPSRGPLLVDGLLALQFAVPHSILLHPATRRRLRPWIASPFYGLFFCAATCLSLLLTIACWRPCDVAIWSLDGPTGAAMSWVFGLSWVALFYSLHLSGLGYQTGLTPWLAWVRRLPPPPREFREQGWYRWFRHPIYLSFLGLIWFTPHMTLDRAVLTGIWTIYIFVGSWLKDRRLEFYNGASYFEYESRVPGYPLLTFGPLGRRRVPSENLAE